MSVLWQTPRKSVIKYSSGTYTNIYFFESMDGMYGHGLTAENQRVYLRPLTEVEVLETEMSFEEFQQEYKGK